MKKTEIRTCHVRLCRAQFARRGIFSRLQATLLISLYTLCGIALCPAETSAPANPPLAAPAKTTPSAPPNRWLIIVDISHGMVPRIEAADSIISQLVTSGMNGQMRPGDTLGVWTYNETLFTGQFPLHECTPQTTELISRRITAFLQDQKFEKNGRLDKIFPQIGQIIGDSEYITVFIISDGSRDIRGTPYDDKINASYRSWRKEQQKGRSPFITLFRANHGKITDYTVNLPPWPLELPALPSELKLAKPAEPVLAREPAPAAPIAPIAPFIVTGNKSQTAATNGSGVAPATTPASVAEAPKLRPPAATAPVVPAVPVVEKPKADLPVMARSTEASAKTVEPPPTESSPGPSTSSGAAIFPSSFFSRPMTWIVGAGVGFLVVLLAFLLGRRSGSEQKISLLGRSADHERQ